MQSDAKTLGELLRHALGDVPVSHSAERTPITAVSCDSRTVGPGALFVAIPGARHDGAQFVADAIRRGAAAVVTQAEAPNASIPVVRVADARGALAALAAEYYGLREIQSCGELTIIGITGTNGKTTTAYMVRAILRAAGRRAALLGTIETDLIERTIASDLTTPDAVTLTKQLVDAHAAGARYAVMEASSHSLAQRRTDGLEFAAAIFTNLTQDHLDYHRTLDDYRSAKQRLFERLPAGAIAVVNADDPASSLMADACRAKVRRFSIEREADYHAEILSESGRGSRFAVALGGGRTELFTPLVGRHNVSNALAAAGVADALGIAPAAIAAGLADLGVVPGRLERIDTGGLGFDVFVDYAHTDDALRNVLRAARRLTGGRLWCVFGCGGDRDRTKRPRMARAVAEGADRFIVTSDNPRTEDPHAIMAEIEAGLSPADRDRSESIVDRHSAIGRAIEQLAPGDVLVIAGKGHEDYQILGRQKVHFDDREAAREAIARRQGDLPERAPAASMNCVHSSESGDVPCAR